MEKPILFSTPMVQAILSGSKTLTRRVMKPQPLFYTGRKYIVPDDAPKKWHDCDDIFAAGLCPYGRTGDVLWVRETWCMEWVDPDGFTGKYLYKADGIEVIHVDDPEKSPWRPSIHMPREAARIFLKVKSVSVGRLQDISEEDAVAEGVRKIRVPSGEQGSCQEDS